jgi:hydrogenase maturation protease
MDTRKARKDLIVIGVGNSLREDDGVGFELIRRLREYFGSDLSCLEVYELDIVLAETLARYKELLVIDARITEDEVPFEVLPLEAKESTTPEGGFISHVFDWGLILALSRDCFGAEVEAKLLGVSATNFGMSETLSPRCIRNADEAYKFLIAYCSEGRTRDL